MQNAFLKVNQLLTLGQEIETTMPELHALEYRIQNLKGPIVKAIAEKYDSPLLEPAPTHVDYRTTILRGKVKIMVVSLPVILTYKIEE